MAKTDKMICSHCNVEMNHHCDKIVYNVDAHDYGKTNPCLGGIVEEFHSCPKCGGAASRHALDSVQQHLPRLPRGAPRE